LPSRFDAPCPSPYSDRMKIIQIVSDAVKFLLLKGLSVLSTPSPVSVPAPASPEAVPSESIAEFHARKDRERDERFRPNGKYDLTQCACVYILRDKINELYFPNHFGTWTLHFEASEEAHFKTFCSKCGTQGHDKKECQKKAKMFKEETLRSIMAQGEFQTHFLTPNIVRKNGSEWQDAPRRGYLIDGRKAKPEAA